MGKAPYIVFTIPLKSEGRALVTGARMTSLNPSSTLKSLSSTVDFSKFPVRCRLLPEDTIEHFQYYVPLVDGKIHLDLSKVNEMMGKKVQVS
jgi:hypothetical protein